MFLPKNYALTILFALCIFRMHGQASIVFHDMSEGLSQQTVTSIVKDHDGFLWIGTEYGLNKFDGFKYEHFYPQENDDNTLSHSHVMSLLVDDDDFLWIGTYGGGVDRLDLKSGEFSHFTKANSKLNDNYITDLFLDQYQQVWVATEKGGISMLNTRSGERNDKARELADIQNQNINVTALSGTAQHILASNWKGEVWLMNPEKGILETLAGL